MSINRISYVIFFLYLEYIEKYCLAKMRDDFKVQLEKFLEGFH